MKLPNADKAVVPSDKITGYLLSLTHPDGREKAAFFIAFGFMPEEPEQLEKALLRQVVTRDCKEHIKRVWCTLCSRRTFRNTRWSQSIGALCLVYRER